MDSCPKEYQSDDVFQMALEELSIPTKWFDNVRFCEPGSHMHLCFACMFPLTVKCRSWSIYKERMMGCPAKCKVTKPEGCDRYVYCCAIILLEIIQAKHINTALILLEHFKTIPGTWIVINNVIKLCMYELLGTGIYCDFTKITDEKVAKLLTIPAYDKMIELLMRNGNHVSIVKRSIIPFEYFTPTDYGVRENKIYKLLLEAAKYDRLEAIKFIVTERPDFLKNINYLKIASILQVAEQHADVYPLLKDMSHWGHNN